MLSRLAGLVRQNYYRYVRSPTLLIQKSSTVTGRMHVRAPGGQIRVGSDCLIEGNLSVQAPNGRIVLQDNVYIGGDTLFACSATITIESDVLISYQCLFMDSDNHSLNFQKRLRDLAEVRSNSYDWSLIDSRPIRVCRGAWVGARSIILKGVTIGTGSIVGAGSVVTRDVPPWSIVAGNPARLIRHLSAEEIGTSSAVPAA
jgi:acetyltransferase-like isoleucine patch superfamily enzyme